VVASNIHVLIDGFGLHDTSRFRGMGTYLRGYLSELARHREVSAMVLAPNEIQLPEGVARKRIRRHLTSTRFGVAEHEILLPLELRGILADVYHSPSQEPPRNVHLPWVQTFHSAILEYQHPQLEAEHRRWARLAPRVRAADAVIAVSQHAADVGIEYLGLEPSRVRVAHMGVDERYKPSSATPKRQEPPNLLSVGQYGPWKGYAEAFAVISELADRGYPHRLRVVGLHHRSSQAEVDGLVAACAHPERIELVDFVTPDKMVEEYRRASALLVTSRCESFGLPALEAMACGTPVVGFRIGGTAEVVGDGGVLVEDGNVEAIVDAVQELLDDPLAASTLAAAGVARAAMFTWKDCVDPHLDVFRQLVS
jgi:glycosyltransferase involved in cell wall biosynthesis